MHEELALAPEESTTPFFPTPNSIDLSCEQLCTKVETPTHTTSFSLCSYKKALSSVIHLWEKGQGEEAQITLDSLDKEFQGLVCPDHGLEVGVCFRQRGCGREQPGGGSASGRPAAVPTLPPPPPGLARGCLKTPKHHAAAAVPASEGRHVPAARGVLYTWTNHLTGWQPRWFVLGNGILSYYDSQNDVCKGRKGSIKMAVCGIKVHSADNTRMELIIPGEQHFYMKAVNAAERQRWLVVLGSSKACLSDTRTKKEKEISGTSESLKTKMSELRLYCDLLMKQVHTIQEFVHHDENHSSPSIENMNEASSLLRAACNTFIITLEECVKIANAKFKPEMFQLCHPDPLVSPVSPSPVQMMKRSERSSHSIKETVSTLHRLSQRRRRTYSDTDSCNDVPLEDPDRPVHCSRNTLNGDLATAIIPEESRLMAKKKSESEDPLPSFSS
ncbi:LOW QUALITY PROTEIN: pleckstrin homology domain-containing family A member 3-like [Eubalaena glacialis]|uniref:LOW QUALITY PROTEIN: pleckstrin homology domain-containing family A member 3-like n=1 Tax=Eubalaena glacialis TaxID=27606 RepID=UPI002A5AE013|nr:LOW QUALITY PROTEIN: pleckstrin homology domain-containing family A member 3-like [Eubalaena glacialis]